MENSEQEKSCLSDNEEKLPSTALSTPAEEFQLKSVHTALAKSGVDIGREMIKVQNKCNKVDRLLDRVLSAYLDSDEETLMSSQKGIIELAKATTDLQKNRAKIFKDMHDMAQSDMAMEIRKHEAAANIRYKEQRIQTDKHRVQQEARSKESKYVFVYDKDSITGPMEDLEEEITLDD